MCSQLLKLDFNDIYYILSHRYDVHVTEDLNVTSWQSTNHSVTLDSGAAYTLLIVGEDLKQVCENIVINVYIFLH